MESLNDVKVQMFLIKDDQVYFIDEVVKGHFILDTYTNMTINFAGIQFFGRAKVCWLAGATVHIGKERYHCDSINLCYGTRILPASRYRYNFEFPLNRNCETSFESKYGCVRYELIFKLNRAPLRKYEFRRAITVINHCDININPIYKMPLQTTGNTTTSCCMFKSRKIVLTLRTPFGTYAPGQKMTYFLELNNQSKKRITAYRLRFYRKIIFTSQTPFRKERHLITEIKSWIKKAEATPNHILQDDIIIPVTSPTTFLSCILNLKYILEVHAMVSCSMFSALKLQMEIHIGTMPLRESLPPKRRFGLLQVEPFFSPNLFKKMSKVRPTSSHSEEQVDAPKRESLPFTPIVQIVERQKDSLETLRSGGMGEVIEMKEISTQAEENFPKTEEIAPPEVAEKQKTPIELSEKQQPLSEVEETGFKTCKANLSPNHIKKLFQAFLATIEPKEQVYADKTYSLPLTKIVEVSEVQEISPQAKEIVHVDVHQEDSLETVQSDGMEEAKENVPEVEENAPLEVTQKQQALPEVEETAIKIVQASSDTEDEEVDAHKRQSQPLTPIVHVLVHQQDSLETAQSDGMREVSEVQEILPQAEENVPMVEENAPPDVAGKQKDLPPNPIKNRFQALQAPSDAEEQFDATKMEILPPLTPTVHVVVHQQDSLETVQSDGMGEISEVQEILPQTEENVPVVEENAPPDVAGKQKDLPPNPIKNRFQALQAPSDAEEQFDATKMEILPPLTPTVHVEVHQQDSLETVQSDGMGEISEVQEILPQTEEYVPKTEEIAPKTEEIVTRTEEIIAKVDDTLQEAEDVSPQSEKNLPQTPKRLLMTKRKSLQRIPYVEVVEEPPTVVVDLPPDSRMRPYDYERSSIGDQYFRDYNERAYFTVFEFRPLYPIYRLD